MTPGRLLERLRTAATSDGSLVQQSVVGGVWVAALNVSDRLLQLLMVVAVARLVGPRAFGLMGIALLALSALNRLSRLGLDEALVFNEEENVDEYLDTTLTLNFLRGGVIAAVAVLAAPLVASVFGEPRATPVLRVLALGPLLHGLRNPGIVYFRKDLEFHREYVYKVSGAAVQLVVGVGYALAFPTVWALVAASLAKRITQLVVSYWIHPHRPWPRFDASHARELVDYGKWLTGSSMIGFLTNQGDDALVGWLLGASPLAFYQMAYRLAKAPNTEVTHVVSRVAFPAYSKLQNDRERLRSAFYRTLRVTLLVAFPAGAGIAAIAPTFVDAFLGDEWLPMVSTLQLIAVYGTTVSLGSICAEIWKAVGRPDLVTKFKGLKAVALAVLILPLTTRYGIFGTAMTIVVADLLLRVPTLVVTARLIDASIPRILRELAFPLAASVGMGALVWQVRDSVGLGIPMLEFVLLVLVGVLAYAAIAGILEVQFGWGLRSEYRSIRVELTGRNVAE